MFRGKWSLTCVAVMAALGCGGAMASQLAKAPAAQPPAKSTVMFQGVQVAIDPATGRLREPTDAERAALTKQMLHEQALQSVMPRAAGQRPRNAAEARATLKQNKRGIIGMSMQVPENQMNYLSAERAPDGALRIHHQGDTAAPAAAREVTQ